MLALARSHLPLEETRAGVEEEEDIPLGVEVGIILGEVEGAGVGVGEVVAVDLFDDSRPSTE